MHAAFNLWRRVDLPGHDACRLIRNRGGWRLEGVAAFLHNGLPAAIHYRVECNHAWVTRKCQVDGWVGGKPFDATITRKRNGDWSLNRLPVAGLETCIDVDLGFTPATNLIQLRRAAVDIGHTIDMSVAWYDVAAVTLLPLPQRYERRSADTYWYESPQFSYAGLLRVNEQSFVESYPGLWESEAGVEV